MMIDFSKTASALVLAVAASPVLAVELDTGASTSTFITMADADCAWDADDRIWLEANDMMIRVPEHALNGAAAWTTAIEEHGADAACAAAKDIHDQYVGARYE